MATPGRLVLGIDINPTEICVVEVKGNWPDAQVSSLGAIPTPERSFHEGKISDPTVIAEALKSLLDQIGVTTREAVIGVSESSVLTRILDIPPIPDHELRPVIEGELAHFQAVNGGAFDFIRLPKDASDEKGAQQALVMATDQETLKSYHAVAEHAGVTVIALEPRLLAMYRAGVADIQMQNGGICISIGQNETEIAITHGGQIRLYRRIDIGKNSLLLDTVHGTKHGRLSFDDDSAVVSPVSDTESLRLLNPSTASTLSIEVQRSLDFFNNHGGEDVQIHRAVISTVNQELSSLDVWLTQSIPMETVICSMPMVRSLSESVALLLSPPAGMRYTCAVGLAMHELSNVPGGTPCFDLSMQQRKQQVQKQTMKRVAIAVAASVTTVLIGGAMAIGMGLQAYTVEKESIRIKSELVVKEKQQKDFITAVRVREDMLSNLRLTGLPFPRIMDEVNLAMLPNVGLTNTALDNNGKLTLNGEATTEKDINQISRNLSNIKYFDSVSTDSFDRISPKDGVFMLRFQISCQLKARRTAAAPSATN